MPKPNLIKNMATFAHLRASASGPTSRMVLLGLLILLSAAAAAPVPEYTFQIVREYPHDPAAFTQGLAYADGFLYEGTGLHGQSTLRRVDIETGKVLAYHELPPQYFGEGVTVFRDRIIQLTWQSQVGFYYDRETFGLIEEFYYPSEGWGLTHDGQRLIMSDGTATLHFLEPVTFSELGRVEVTDNGKPVSQLNELEFINGEVWANVWPTNRIARIDLPSGKIVGWVDLTGLLAPADRHGDVDVLNGIAYDAESHRLFVTGKRWPKLFEILIVPKK